MRCRLGSLLAVVACALLTAGLTTVPGEALTTTVASPAGAASSADARPNIVWIVVDDMRQDDLQYMPRTRRLLGDQGVTFANSFSPNPVCCPARASFLTGQYTHNHRVFKVDKPYGFPSFDDQSTLATWLRSAGYNTLYLGKYLNGYGPWPEPGATTGKSVRYRPPGWTRWHASIDGGLPKTHPMEGGTYRYMGTTISNDSDGFVSFKGTYQTHAYRAFTARLIRDWAPRPKPFFLVASYTAPHNGGPAERDDVRFAVDDSGTTVKFGSPAVPEALRGKFDHEILEAPGASWTDPDPTDKPAYLSGRGAPNQAEQAAMLELSRQRAESLYAVDQAVQRTVRALADSGELDNTVVIFTSDNGYFLGEQYIRQGKILPHEPSLRTPTLIRGPGMLQGAVVSDPITSVDFAPTVAELAGADAGLLMDGVSVVETLRTGDQGWTRGVLTETGPRETIRETDESGEPLNAQDPGARDLRWAIGVRTPRYMYLDLATGEEELYDVVSDPQQYHNVAHAPAFGEVLTLLRQHLRKIRACDGPECHAPLPPELSAG